VTPGFSRERSNINEPWSLTVTLGTLLVGPSLNTYTLSTVRRTVDFDKLAAAVKTVCLYWLVVNEPPERQLSARENYP
jgi:hypothetical protein